MKDPMRLLLVIPRIDSYRAFFRELCFELNARGAEIHIACSVEALQGHSRSVLDGWAQFHPLTLPRGMNPISHLKAARDLNALVRRLRPDIVDTHFSAAIFTTALARRAGWPITLGTFHGVSFPLVSGPKGRLLKVAEGWAAERLDTVWVLTESDRERLREAARSATVKVWRSSGVGCDLAEFDPDRVTAPERLALRERLGLEPEHRVFVFVGRFVAFKGFDLTVRTFLRIADRHPHLRLLLVGAPDQLHPTGLTPLEDQACRQCPQIINAGYQTDVASYLAVSHIMVFPSRREGMPVCVMQALAMGVPVITRASRGCRDAVRHRRDGLVLRDCTADALAKAMILLATDDLLRVQYSREALAGRQRFDRGTFVRDQINRYRQHAAVRAARNTDGHESSRTRAWST